MDPNAGFIKKTWSNRQDQKSAYNIIQGRDKRVTKQAQVRSGSKQSQVTSQRMKTTGKAENTKTLQAINTQQSVCVS